MHTLKLDLALHRQCRELPLQLLSAADVAQYLALRFGVGMCPAALAHFHTLDQLLAFMARVLATLEGTAP